jgi:hypothetical protein
LIRTAQPWVFRTLLPSPFRVLLGCGFLLVNDFAHAWHCPLVQCFDVAAIAGILTLPTLTAAVIATAAIPLVGLIL